MFFTYCNAIFCGTLISKCGILGNTTWQTMCYAISSRTLFSYSYLANERNRLLKVFFIFGLSLEDSVNYPKNLYPVISAIKHADVQNHWYGEHIVIIYHLAIILWCDELCLQIQQYNATYRPLIWLVYSHITHISYQTRNARIMVAEPEEKWPPRICTYR
jgi:hypothetical protein